MKFVIDANLPRSLGHSLRAIGHDVFDVRDLGLGNAADGMIDAYAIDSGAILISRDLDFGDVRNYPLKGSPGRIIVRFPPQSHAELITAAVMQFATNVHLLPRVIGALTIIEPGRVRFRRAIQ